jgi:uncharacterized DUF497 family protein
MKEERTFKFDKDKNKKLLVDRGIDFERIILELNSNREFTIVEHPNKTQYPKQKMFIIEIKNYIYAVPFVQEKRNCFFLKTIFPSRKLTKKYLLKTKN